MGVYRNGYNVMLEPHVESFEEYIILLKNFILENTPWTLDEDNSSSTTLVFDTGYEHITFSPYSNDVSRMNLKITTDYSDQVVSATSVMKTTTVVNNITYSSCTLYSFIKEGLSIWYVHETTSSSLSYTKYSPDNLLYDYVYMSQTAGIGVCQVEFEDITNNRMAQTRAVLYNNGYNSLFGTYPTSAKYELIDGTWKNCYIYAKNYRYSDTDSYDDSVTISNDIIYKTRLFVYESSDTKKILGFIPQLYYIIRPSKSIPRIYYPFKNNGYKYQYISYPIAYVEKEGV